MTRILLEPNEMQATAGTLQHTADELSGIGAGVRHDCATCLPSRSEAIADAVVELVDQILDVLAVDLLVKANDLLIRGITATTDSLTVASSASGLESVPVATVGVIGGNNFGAMTITPGELLGGSVVGGTSPGWSIDPAAYAGGSVVGGTSGFVGGGATALLGGSFVGGQTASSAELDRFAAGSPGGFLPPTFAEDALSHHNTVILQPSRGNLISERGIYMSPAEYTQRGYRGLNE